MKLRGIALAAVLAAFVIGGVILVASREGEQRETTVVINELRIPVEIAESTAERERGLSGRESLAADSGMLFIFSAPDTYRFWMPDMHFPIDIIWIADEKIVGIDENVSNEFDPENPTYYTPPVPVTHVLEVNAGFARAHNIQAGDTVILPAVR